MKSKASWIIWILLLLVGAIIVLISLPWAFLFIGLQLEPNPPAPDIRYGEFPFRLEYEIDGQRKVIEDTLLCEFDGFGSDEGRGKYRKWKQRLASGGTTEILLDVHLSKEISFFPGSAEYYMGESDNVENDSSYPNAVYFEKDGIVSISGFIPADQLFEEYQIKLISWDASPPIKNEFTSSQ